MTVESGLAAGFTGQKGVVHVRNERKVRRGETVIWVAYITLKNGKRIYASQYGLRAFPIKVRNAA